MIIKDPDKKKNLFVKKIYNLHSNPKISNFINFHSSFCDPFFIHSFSHPFVNHTDLKPFWNTNSLLLSEDLWFPYFTNNSKKKDYLVNIPYSKCFINHQSNEFSNIIPFNNQSNFDNLKIARKIKFKPSADLKKYFVTCFGIYRYFYNKTIQYFNTKFKNRCDEIDELNLLESCCHFDNNKKPCMRDVCPLKHKYYDFNCFCDLHLNEKLSFDTDLNFYKLRDEMVTKEDQLNEADKWQTDLIFDSRCNAVEDALTALRSCITKKIKYSQPFYLKFKKKKIRGKYLNYHPNTLI